MEYRGIADVALVTNDMGKTVRGGGGHQWCDAGPAQSNSLPNHISHLEISADKYYLRGTSLHRWS